MLASLSSEQREVIQLKYFHDLDYKTIALIMNVSICTVKSLIASPTMTMIEGKIDTETINEQSDSFYAPHEDLILIANRNY